MALFRRKKDSVLPEVDQYYQAERRDRTGLAWMLALLSIALVAGVIVAIFLAGRWAYNEITSDDEPSEVATTQTEDAPSFDGSSTEEPSSNEEGQGDQEVPAPAPASTPAPAPQKPNPQPTTPQTGDNGSLPRTGPADVVVVFGVVSTTAAAAHYAVQRRKQNS
jgi:cytoskeletal protein RodZ